jgi:hypothetical protein
MKKLVCRHCGSGQVDLSGFVHWDYEKQDFVVTSIDVLDVDHLENQYADCAFCGKADQGVAVWEELS